ncbi:uncharacterized protein METZ01_LOCUS320044, partial [marine metagenome]
AQVVPSQARWRSGDNHDYTLLGGVEQFSTSKLERCHPRDEVVPVVSE